jgi:phosphatidylserine/phosphatidylglycerophosphate/cardiolipin synthase-like enzyme
MMVLKFAACGDNQVSSFDGGQEEDGNEWVEGENQDDEPAPPDGDDDQTPDLLPTDDSQPDPLYTVISKEDFDDPALLASLFFTPAQDLETLIMDELSKATQSVRLAMFNIRLQEIADKLLALHQAGVDVKIIMDQKQMDKSYNTLDDWMIENGLDLTGVLNDSSSNATMHNKFLIIDQKRVLTGSLNYSYTAFNKSDEDILLIESTEIAIQFEDEFEELLAGGEVPRDNISGPVELYFSPEDRLDLMTIEAINAAQTYIEIIMFSASLEGIFDALETALNRGVHVVLLFDQAQSENTDLDETIETAGAHVVRTPRSFPVELHDKLCVADGNTLLVGSYNWTPTASFYNHENYLKIESAALSTRVESKVAGLLQQEVTNFDPLDFGFSAGDRTVEFSISNLEVRSDGSCYIMGNHPALGNNSISNSIEMTRNNTPQGETWSVTVSLPPGSEIEYRYLVKDSTGLAQLENASPRSFVVPFSSRTHPVYDTFRK